jgi:NCS2 family nucleobase:cation symporter-2
MTDYQDPDRLPPLPQALALGLQHVLAMIASNITVPLIILGAAGFATEANVIFLQAAILAAGVATLIQTIGIGPVGARLPVVQGTSFAYIPVLIPIAKSLGMAAVLGGALLSGIAQMVLGLFVGRIRHMIPPLVSGIVVVTIGLSLLPVGIRYAGGGVNASDFGDPKHLLLSGLVIVVAVALRGIFAGFLGAAGVFLAIVTGYLAALSLGMVNLAPVAEAAWLSMPDPLHYGMAFPVAVIVPMIVLAFVTSVETVGDISGITVGGAGREPSNRELRGGILGDGLGTVLAALLNALPNTSYSQNVGLVSFTGVMSRHVVSLGALVLIAAGFVPKIAAVAVTIPPAVLGGAMTVMFGLVTAAGIKLMSLASLDRRDLIVIALALGLGLGIDAVPDIARVMPDAIKPLLVSGIVPAALVAFLLNLVLPRGTA